MKFRNKLMIIMVGMALLSNGVLVAVTTFQSRTLLLNEIRSKVLSIASTTASQVDPEIHERIRTEDDIDGDDYVRLEALFRRIRDANRREDTNVRFVYTLRPIPGRTGVYEYVVDAEERGSPDKSKVGEEHQPKERQRLIPLDREEVQIGSDAYGTFLSATSPIRDKSGVAVALLGVDLNIEDVLARTNQLWIVGLGGMAMAGGVGAFLALVLSRRVSKVLEQLVVVVRRVGEGDYDVKAPDDGEDEFSQLGKALNYMVPQIREGMKLKDSLALAMEVQQSLLPSEPPQVNGLEIAGRSIYCDETGGDYFDFLDLSNVSRDRVAIAVGDVTGQGIADALLMTTARALLRGHAAQGGSLAQLITHMNRHLAVDCKAGRFMTMYYLVIDSETRELRWVSAGHDPAIAYNPSTDVFVEL
ncbi:MAG: SpoIIE family protein phosphatase, partial [Phycisphaerales bacterium]|nr:SpoIIE family protein phosphatase [Phycisphaerales bacterium]